LLEIEALPYGIVAYRRAAQAAVQAHQLLPRKDVGRQPLRGDQPHVGAVAGQHTHGAGLGAGEPDHGTERAFEQFFRIIFVRERAGKLG
jgi:hypothetical protein